MRVFLVMLILILSMSGLLAFVSYDRPSQVVTRVVEVERKPRPVKELIENIPPEYGISPLVMSVIVERESGGRNDAIRYEPGQMPRAAKLTKNAEKQRALASSHGLAQVMGWWAPEFKLEWFQLYDPETNIKAASAILKRCMDKQTAKTKTERLRGALACYNGSNAYADAIIARIGSLLIEQEL